MPDRDSAKAESDTRFGMQVFENRSFVSAMISLGVEIRELRKQPMILHEDRDWMVANGWPVYRLIGRHDVCLDKMERGAAASAPVKGATVAKL